MISIANIHDELKNTGLLIDGIDAIQDITINAFLRDGSDLIPYFSNFFMKYGIRLNILNNNGQWWDNEKPLLFINCSETELDKDNAKYFAVRNINKFTTLPLLFFSDVFFTLERNERFELNPILNGFYNYSKNPPMSFFMNENSIDKDKNLTEYLEQLAESIKLFNIIDYLKSLIKKLENQIIQVSQQGTSIDDVFTKFFIADSLKSKLDKFNLILKECYKKEDDIKIFYQNIQDRNEKKALEKLNYDKDLITDNPVANRINLHYGNLLPNISNFFEDIECSKVSEIINKSRDIREVYDKKSEIAFLGTFSSGKTTFINSLIRSRHSLKTSARHNSAVILKIFHCNSQDEERYFIKYKKVINDLKLIKNTSTDKTNINDVILCCSSKSDILSIYDNIKKKSLKDYSLKITYMNLSEKNVTGDEVPIILNYLSEKTSNIADTHRKLTDIMPTVSNTETNDIGNNSKIIRKYLTDATDISFSCKSLKQNKNVILNDKEWKSFCENDNDIFIESPECYLYAEEIDLYVYSTFLENCNIVDTPGFGSVTENHDAITENFLNNYKGILIIMIKVDIKALSEDVIRLVKHIGEIYKLNRNNFLSVYFLFNCFESISSKSNVLTNCSKLKNMINEEGFVKPKIFACNMKNTIEEFSPYQNYEQFISSIEDDIKKNGINAKLREFSISWRQFLDTQETDILTKLEEYQNSEEERKQKHENALFNQKRLNSMKIKSFESIESKIRDDFSVLLDFVDTLDKKKEWKSQQKTFKDYIEAMGMNLKDENHLCNVYRNACGDINMATDFEMSGKMQDISEDKFYKFSYPVAHIISKFDSLLDENWGFFYCKKKKIFNELKNEIIYQRDESIDKFRNAYNGIRKKIDGYKLQAKESIEKTIKETSSQEQAIKAIKSYKKELAEYKNVDKKFSYIEKQIENYI